MIRLLLRAFRAWTELAAREGVVFHAPPLVISASSPMWWASLPLRVLPAPEVTTETVVTRTDPYVVAQRRASLRLVSHQPQVQT